MYTSPTSQALQYQTCFFHNLSEDKNQEIITCDKYQNRACHWRWLTRLLIGEGNFSFALALIQKHDYKTKHDLSKSLGHSIVATELRNEISCSTCLEIFFSKIIISSEKPTFDESIQPIRCGKCTETAQRIAELEKKGAIVRLGIDGTKLHEIEKFKDKKFTRIHWNCPHASESRNADYKKQELPPIILHFFKSCRYLQNTGDQVHMTLVQPSNQKDFYQGYIYNIVKAATSGGYVLVKKRKFNQARYPGYSHVMAGTNQSPIVPEKEMSEFVFKKLDDEAFMNCLSEVEEKHKQTLLIPVAKNFGKYSEKKYTVMELSIYETPRAYFSCSSDEDSSDYESS